MKKLHDFPELDAWFDGLSHTNGANYVHADSVVRKVEELANKLEEKQKLIDEVFSFIGSEQKCAFFDVYD